MGVDLGEGFRPELMVFFDGEVQEQSLLVHIAALDFIEFQYKLESFIAIDG